ncbi:hypothetical protein AAC387_Pa11g0753 [Persea americana]
MRFGLLKRIASEVVRSSEPFTVPLSLEPTSSFARAFLFRNSSLERTLTCPSEPLTESWSLEPPSFFARPLLTQSSSLEQTLTHSSEPLTELCSFELPILRLNPPDWNLSARADSLSARANCTEFLGLFHCFHI